MKLVCARVIKKYVAVITYRHNDKVKILKAIDGRDRKPVESFLNSIPKRLKTQFQQCALIYMRDI